MTGRVKSYAVETGYGFIRAPGVEPDVFLHVSDIVGGRIPCRDDVVEFYLVRIPKGLVARRVRIVTDSPRGQAARTERRS